MESPDARLVCPCSHFEVGGKVPVELEDGGYLRKSDPNPVVPKDPMIELLREFKNEFPEARQVRVGRTLNMKERHTAP